MRPVPLKSKNPHGGPNSGLRLAIAATALLLLGALIWAGFAIFSPADNGEPKVITADTGTYKDKPAQPGGMPIPDKDKLVYNSVTLDGKNTPETDHVMPPPEKPLNDGDSPPPAVAALGRAVGDAEGAAPNSVADAPAAAAFDQTQSGQAGSNKPQDDKTVPKTLSDKTARIMPVGDGKDTEKAQKKPAKAAAEATAADAPAAADGATFTAAANPIPAEEKDDDKAASADSAGEAAVKKPAAGGQAGGKPRFQLASYADRAQAEKAMAELQHKFSGALPSQLFIVEAQIEGKGLYYRIQGSVDSGGDVAGVCAAVRADGGACVAVRP